MEIWQNDFVFIFYWTYLKWRPKIGTLFSLFYDNTLFSYGVWFDCVSRMTGKCFVCEQNVNSDDMCILPDNIFWGLTRSSGLRRDGTDEQLVEKFKSPVG